MIMQDKTKKHLKQKKRWISPWEMASKHEAFKDYTQDEIDGMFEFEIGQIIEDWEWENDCD
tara:strand:- start:4034 stop:4216 length:183 start_codon:yes stop_codon:yes gene_type:complete